MLQRHTAVVYSCVTAWPARQRLPPAPQACTHRTHRGPGQAWSVWLPRGAHWFDNSRLSYQPSRVYLAQSNTEDYVTKHSGVARLLPLCRCHLHRRMDQRYHTGVAIDTMSVASHAFQPPSLYPLPRAVAPRTPSSPTLLHRCTCITSTPHPHSMSRPPRRHSRHQHAHVGCAL